MTTPEDRKTIAVVDHDPAARNSFKALLENEGYEVELFAGGVNFLSALPALSPHCLLIDWRIPDIDCSAILGKLSELSAPLPTIVMSTIPKLIAPSRAGPLGVSFILEKPIEAACLFDAIRQAIEGGETA